MEVIHMPGAAPSRIPAPPCPHCGGTAVCGYGSFRLKDGTRQKRFLCRSCGRTFHRLTNTPLHYLKKRDRWSRFVSGMVEGLTLRHAAEQLGVHVATTFRWRHRLLLQLASRPQPVLEGRVLAADTFVPYSEKGSRRTNGPGAYGVRQAARNRNRPVVGTTAPVPGQGPGLRPFRSLADGKPTCVLLAATGVEQVVIPISHGRPTADRLAGVLQGLLANGAELQTEGLAPYAEACARLGVRSHTPPGILARVTDTPGLLQFTRSLHPWLRRFRGVATKYLSRYLGWYQLVRAPKANAAQLALLTLKTQSETPRPITNNCREQGGRATRDPLSPTPAGAAPGRPSLPHPQWPQRLQRAAR